MNRQKSPIYYIDPFGCAKNQVDAETMMAHLDTAGWRAAPNPDAADIIIVNSCGFIEAAKRESINAVIEWKKQYPGKKILLAGCLAQRYRAELEENLVEADGLLGCDELTLAPEKAAALIKNRRPRKMPLSGKTTPRKPRRPSAGKRPLLGFPGLAYVKISEGCNNNCSFCAIPLIRGPLRCRSIPDIVTECKQLLERGVKELCLIGQDLASYNPADTAKNAANNASAAAGRAAERSGLASLLEAIAALPGDFWLRFLYLHPDHFPLDILDIVAKDKRFLPYFDIPFQHASPNILAAMGRRGGAKTYLSLLDAIRKKNPHAVIRSTFLVGFPGETEEDFAALLDFQKKARFDWLGVFTWSREEGTAAYSMKNRVSKKNAAARKALVEEQQIPITEKNMNRFIGKTLDALVEEQIDDGAGLWIGRLFCQAPEVDGAAVIRRASVANSSGESSGESSGRKKSGGQSPSGQSPQPGNMIRGTVVARAGFDLELIV